MKKVEELSKEARDFLFDIKTSCVRRKVKEPISL
jgi:hypothetical protein